jgi:hypothetical protein
MPPERIVAGGRVIPSVIALAHERHKDGLCRFCPAALPAAVVTGDPCFDRMSASMSLRDAYRAALGVVADQKLVVVSSTWGQRSLIGRHGDLPLQLARELPSDAYRVAAILHPTIWNQHGYRQVREWYRDDRLQLIPPEQGWQAATIAADVVVGDHGSVTSYAASIGEPILLAAYPDEDIVPGSMAAMVSQIFPRLDYSAPLSPQLDGVMDLPNRRDELEAALTSFPGQAVHLLRREMYGLLGMAEPAYEAMVEPLPPPLPIRN